LPDDFLICRWKTPEIKQVNKYTPKNMDYYSKFLFWISNVEPERVVFLDESHFSPKGPYMPLLVGYHALN